MNTDFISQFVSQFAPGNLSVYGIIYNIPLFIFDFFLFAVFLLFLRALIVIIFSGGKELRIEAGKRNLYAALFWLLFLLFSSFIFYSITKYLEGPGAANGEFPVLSNSDFAPAPAYKNIGGYNFAGPFALSGYNKIKKPAIYSVLCKNGDDYVIIYLKKTENDDLLANKDYPCWLSNCLDDPGGLYVAALHIAKTSDNSSSEKLTQIKDDLDKQITVQCKESSQ